MEFQTWQDSSAVTDNVWELEASLAPKQMKAGLGLVYWHQSYFGLPAKIVHTAGDVFGLF